MRFVTNNVNVVLMSTIVLLAIFGVAYYNIQESKFQEVSMENAQLEAQVAQLETNLTAQEERLRDIFGDLQAQLQDSVKFENLYSEVTSERDDLETELSDLEDDLQSERSDRLAAEREQTTLQTQVNELNISNAELRDQLVTCTEDLDDCRTELEEFC